MARRLKKRSEDDQSSVSLIPIMNLVCLLIPFLLYTASFVVFATVDVNAPRIPNVSAHVERGEPNLNLNLTLVITDQGFRLASGEESALPVSCGSTGNETGAALYIPLSSEAAGCASPGDQRERQALRLGPPSCSYDFDQLKQCMQDIKADHPNEEQIMISGERNVDYDTLINAMDATRGEDDSPLFPKVSLVAGLA